MTYSNPVSSDIVIVSSAFLLVLNKTLFSWNETDEQVIFLWAGNGAGTMGKSCHFHPLKLEIFETHSFIFKRARGWSGGAMVLGKLPVSERPTNLD